MNNLSYKYKDLVSDLKSIKNEYPHIPVFSIGKTVENRAIYAIKWGNGPRRIFLNGCHHGTEWLTAKVLVEFAKALATSKVLTSSSVYIVPMVNPDGVEIASRGIYWQANAKGVDLNHNYDALWELSRQTEILWGITEPGPTRYGGSFPESEPESKAVANFTRQNVFDITASLHSQGEVIYYDFCGIVPDGTEDYLSRFEAVSNYKRDIPEGIASYGGYKDWFIKKYKKPAFTIEIGLGQNPLPLSDFDKVYEGVFPILKELVR